MRRIKYILYLFAFLLRSAFLSGYLVERRKDGDKIYLDDRSQRRTCKQILFAKDLGNGVCKCDGVFSTLSIPRYSTTPTRTSCQLFSLHTCGNKFITTAASTFGRLSIPIKVAFQRSLVVVRRVYVWNMESKSLQASWLDVTDYKRVFFTVSRGNLVTSLYSDFWRGQLIRVEYNYQALCTLLKVEGARNYPVELPVGPTKHPVVATEWWRYTISTGYPTITTTTIPFFTVKTTAVVPVGKKSGARMKLSTILGIAVGTVIVIVILSICCCMHCKEREGVQRTAQQQVGVEDLDLRGTPNQPGERATTSTVHASAPPFSIFQPNKSYPDSNGVFDSRLQDPPPPYPPPDSHLPPPGMMPPAYESVVNYPHYPMNIGVHFAPSNQQPIPNHCAPNVGPAIADKDGG